MRVAIIGRSETLYKTASLLRDMENEIVCIITSKEAPEYTKSSKDFEVLADKWKIPFAFGPNINSHIGLLEKVNADIGVSINYTGVIPTNVVEMFRFGILNAHGGDLPRYRGNACQAWAIINGEKRIGLCIHKMRGGELDSGDIIARDYIAINNETKIGHVYDWIFDRTPTLMVQSVEALRRDPNYVLEVQSLENMNSLRCYPRLPEDGKIDWKQNSQQIIRLINASGKPYSGAFFIFNDKKYSVFDVKELDSPPFLAVPGQITNINENSIEVATLDGKVLLSNIFIDDTIVKIKEVFKSVRLRLK
ncbi:MAG: formyltransferase family protein [Bacteroidetes bacterium]|nr:formyltransferase family protein [Bacteroidota bacterium]MDA0851613.1 formyltransferase family protein [Pseudomonadota bacterium]